MGSLSDFVSSGAVADYQEFTSSGTWTKPDGVNFVYVEAIGGGGGGANGNSVGAGGGGGGEGYTHIFRASELGATETVTIGAGGAGGVGGGGSTSGSNGGNTSFGSHMTAFGGLKGSTSTAYGLPRRISGYGWGYNYIGYASFAGVAPGANSLTGGPTIYGGGAGGGCNSSTGAGSGTTSEFGGSGGNATQTATPGLPGSAPGGGGGANNKNSGGGDGADGRVRVWSW